MLRQLKYKKKNRKRILIWSLTAIHVDLNLIKGLYNFYMHFLIIYAVCFYIYILCFNIIKNGEFKIEAP